MVLFNWSIIQFLEKSEKLSTIVSNLMITYISHCASDVGDAVYVCSFVSDFELFQKSAHKNYI